MKAFVIADVKEEVENVLVEFSTSSSTAIISSHLVSSIYTAHVLVIANDSCGACHFTPTTIPLPSQHKPSFCGLTVTVHRHHYLLVHPRTSTNTFLLNSE